MAKAIDKFYARDREVLTGIGKVGFFYKEDIERFYTDQKGSRLESIIEGNGFLKETPIQGENATIYTLTHEGRRFIKEKWDVTAYTFKSVKHDDVMRKTYLEYSKEERYRTMSEPDFRKFVNEEFRKMRYSDDKETRRIGNEMSMKLEMKEYSLPDMAVVRDEQYHPEHSPSLSDFTLTESVTDNYPQSTIDAKMEFAVDTGATMNMTYVK